MYVCVAVMCESLGLGMKDKCLPSAMTEPVRTATMELALQLFPPLLSVLHLLQTPHTNLGILLSSFSVAVPVLF